MDDKRFEGFIRDLRELLDNCETFCKERDYVHIQYAEVKMRMENLINRYTEFRRDKLR